jgi:hypothetical protein
MKLHNLIFGIALIITVISVSMSLSVNVPFEADLSFADGFQTITDADGKRWDVQFEYTTNSTFTGVVRHTSRWREADVPFMSHDILVTTGEFADPDLVRTSVSNHHFLWRSKT